MSRHARTQIAALFFALLLSVESLAIRAAADDAFLLKGAQLIDPAKRKVTRANLLIADGKIAWKGEGTPTGFKGKVLELSGKFVIPGFVDLHVHSWGNTFPIPDREEDIGHEESLKRMLYCGVIAALDLGAKEDVILGLRDRQRKEGLPGAILFAAGPVFGYGDPSKIARGSGYRGIRNPEEARAQVDELSGKKPDVIKIIYDHAGAIPHSMDRPTMEAALKRARELGFPVVVHIGTWKDAEEATLAGASVITHLHDEGVIPRKLVRLMKEKKTLSIPTMAVQTEMAHLTADPSLLRDPLLQAVASPELLAAYLQNDRYSKRSAGWSKNQVLDEPDYARSLKLLVSGGVPILTGSDSGNVGTFQGYSLHREMEILAHDGVPPWKVLAGATTDAGKFLGFPLGLNAGAEAELVVLSKSPLQDMKYTKEIEFIIHRGKIVDRSALFPRK